MLIKLRRSFITLCACLYFANALAQILPVSFDEESGHIVEFSNGERFSLRVDRMVRLGDSTSMQFNQSQDDQLILLAAQNTSNYIYLLEQTRPSANGYVTRFLIAENNYQYKLELKASLKTPRNGQPYFFYNFDWDPENGMIGSNLVGPCTPGASGDDRSILRTGLSTYKLLKGFTQRYLNSKDAFVILCHQDGTFMNAKSIEALGTSEFDELKSKKSFLVVRSFVPRSL